MNLTVVTAPGPQPALIFTLALCVVQCRGDPMSGWGASGRHGRGTASPTRGETLLIFKHNTGALNRTARPVLQLL